MDTRKRNRRATREANERSAAARPNEAAARPLDVQTGREKPGWPGWLDNVPHPYARAFLARYAECGNVSQAAREVGVDRKQHYRWLEELPGYREAWEHAEQEAADRLEQEAWRRAVEGWDEPVYQRGQMVGTVRRYSDALLTLLLRGVRPQKFRERVDIGSEPGRPLAVQVSEVDAEAAARVVAEFARQRHVEGAVSGYRADAAPDA